MREEFFKRFPIENITFQNPRMQNKVAEEIKDTSEDKDLQAYVLTGVPQVAIIERAIKFYEDNAEKEYKILYSATAKWLRQLMSTPVHKKKEEAIEVILNEAEKETEDERAYNIE